MGIQQIEATPSILDITNQGISYFSLIIYTSTTYFDGIL